MNLGLENKVVVITGASRGIGAAVARHFAQEGSRLALLSRGRDDLDRLARELRETREGLEVQTFNRDATERDCAEAVIEEVIARTGQVDILVNNAGAGFRRSFEDVTDADWAASLELNLMAAIRFSRAVLPDMKRRREGRIINVAAVSASRPRLGQIASNVGKAGLLNFTRSLALETAPYNILVNAVCPGSVDSPRWRARLEAMAREKQKSPDELIEHVVGSIPLGRVGKPEEVAGIIAFLAGHPAGYMTGTVINVDGGLEIGIM